MLEHLLGSKGRAALLADLFDGKRRKRHIRELARRAGLSAPSLMREAKGLVRLGLLIEERDGNRLDYTANVASPLYGTIEELVSKTAGGEVVLREAFADAKASVVFIYGSRARGNARADSDYDIFVIGDEGLRGISRRVRAAAQKIDVEINPYVVSPSEFSRRLKAQDHFLTEVMASPKIFIKGGADELAGME